MYLTLVDLQLDSVALWPLIQLITYECYVTQASLQPFDDDDLNKKMLFIVDGWQQYIRNRADWFQNEQNLLFLTKPERAFVRHCLKR